MSRTLMKYDIVNGVESTTLQTITQQVPELVIRNEDEQEIYNEFDQLVYRDPDEG